MQTIRSLVETVSPQEPIIVSRREKVRHELISLQPNEQIATQVLSQYLSGTYGGSTIHWYYTVNAMFRKCIPKDGALSHLRLLVHEGKQVVRHIGEGK